MCVCVGILVSSVALAGIENPRNSIRIRHTLNNTWFPYPCICEFLVEMLSDPTMEAEATWKYELPYLFGEKKNDFGIYSNQLLFTKSTHTRSSPQCLLI